MNRLAFKRILTSSILVITCFIALGQKGKEVTRKEHLEQMDLFYFDLTDKLWDFVSHVANGEKISKLDKKRRDVAKYLYSEKKKVEEYGDYEGDKVVLDAFLEYIEDCRDVVKEDYKNLLPIEAASHKSPDSLKLFYEEIFKVNQKLSDITEKYNQVNLAYRKKYFSYSKFDKEDKDLKIPENKIIVILDVYRGFMPVDIGYLFSKIAEENLFQAFEKRDSNLIEETREELKKIITENENILNKMEAFNDDSSYIKGFAQVIQFHKKTVEETIPKMYSYYLQTKAFEETQKEFLARDKSKLTPDDYDEMDILTNEINVVFNEFNIMYNHYTFERLDINEKFERNSNHYLARHIVRDK